MDFRLRGEGALRPPTPALSKGQLYLQTCSSVQILSTNSPDLNLQSTEAVGFKQYPMSPSLLSPFTLSTSKLYEKTQTAYYLKEKIYVLAKDFNT